MSPPKRTMHMYLGAQALEDMHRPCYSDLGLNRFFALISRYRNQLRLRDHAQASVLGTSGSKVYTNISLTPPLSLSLRLIKMRYWNQNKNPIYLNSWSVCSSVLKSHHPNWMGVLSLPKIQHNVRMFFWERSFVKYKRWLSSGFTKIGRGNDTFMSGTNKLISRHM